MKRSYKICIAIVSWSLIGLAVITPFVTNCTNENDDTDDWAIEEGLLRNDDLVAVKSSNGMVRHQA